MGIKGLNKFLKSKCPDVFKTIDLSTLCYMKGAVDISLYMFKYKTIFGDAWPAAILNFISCLRSNDIHACFIYDTSSPKEKEDERKKRKNRRDKLDDKLMVLIEALEKAKLTGEIDPILIELNETLEGKKKTLLRPEQKKPINLAALEYEISKKQTQAASVSDEDFTLSKQLLDIIGIPWFQAPMEAETTCADLCIQNRVDVVFSEDSDVLCYGAPFVVTKVNTGDNTAVVVSHSDILEALNFTKSQFIDFCIMCGTDYNSNIFKIGPEKAFKLIVEYGSIDAIKNVDTSTLNHIRTRQLFTEYTRVNEVVTFCKPPDMSKLEHFVMMNNIRVNMTKIKQNLQPREIIIEDE